MIVSILVYDTVLPTNVLPQSTSCESRLSSFFKSTSTMRMSSISSIMARGTALLRTREESSSSMSTTMIDLLIALMVLIFVSLLLVGALYTVRKIRRNRAISRQQLPIHHDGKPISNHRRLTITTT